MKDAVEKCMATVDRIQNITPELAFNREQWKGLLQCQCISYSERTVERLKNISLRFKMFL